MSQLSHAQFPLRRHPDLLVDHRRARSAAVAEPRGANVESRDRLRWPASFRNRGRDQIGTVADIKSESPAGLRRNSHGEFTSLGFTQFDMVAYVHPGLLANREAQTNQAMNQLFGTCPRLPRSPTSRVSTWPSSTPTAVSSANRPRKLTCSDTSKSRRPACTRWCSPSNAPASSGGPRASRAASTSWSSPRTSQCSVELETVKTSVQRN